MFPACFQEQRTGHPNKINNMALAININDLLNKQKIESNRIEFKKGWNPGSIYHSICAFANDFDDLGG